MLDIHKVKPIHGWREFVGEVGIIVLGVLIALSAEQVVEAVHWRHQVAEGRDSLRDNAEFLVEMTALREMMSPCIGRRLDELAVLLDDASDSGRLPEIYRLGGPSGGTFAFDTWNGLVASQVATHFPHEQAGNIYGIASMAATLTQSSKEELNDWTTLSTMTGRSRPFGDAEQAQVRIALGHATLVARRMLIGINFVKGNIVSSGLLTKAEVTAIRSKTYRASIAEFRQSRMCQPVSEKPSSNPYGRAPIGDNLQQPFKP